MGGWGVPGVGADRSVTESVILWGADQARNGVLWQSAVISGAARDAGNSPTTVLRPGLILGKVTTTGELEEWDADATDGTENIWGVLDTEIRAQDFDATDADRVFRVIVGRAPLKAGSLLVQGTAMTSAADEFLARRQLVAAGCVFDDDPFGYEAGINPRVARVTGQTDTLTAAENGSLILYSNAATVTVTLPAIQPGLSYDLLREGDEEFIVTSGEGNNVIFGNDLSGSTITFTTAGNHIGVMVRVQSLYVAGTLKWLLTLPNVPIGTGVNTLPFGLA
jgi:hypothetical protein